MVKYWNYPKRKRSYGAIKRRRYAYKKRKYARRRMVARPSLDNHCYKRWGASLAYNWSSTNSYDQAYVASLDKVLSYTEFTGLYDQYRILKVVHKFRLINNPDANTMPNQNTGTNAANMYPRLWYCPDYDDNTPNNWTVLRERAKTKCKILQPNKQISVAYRPACNLQVYRSAITTAYAPKWKQYIDVTQPDVPHYGLKWSVEVSGFTPDVNYPYSLQLDTIYYIQCRGTR